MSTMLGLRKATRSPSVGIGAKDLSAATTSWVNLDNPRVARDLARHNTLGQEVAAQPARFQFDTATVNGCLVTPRNASLTLDIGVGAVTYNWGDSVYTKGVVANVGTALTQAVTPNATNPLVAAIGLNTSTPATPSAAILAGTAAATETEDKFTAAYSALITGPAIQTTADRTWLALVWVPPAIALTTPFGIAATGVFTATGHGFRVGDPVWFTTLTGPTAGIAITTVYYVNTVPSTSTFTVSLTPGGPTLLWTTNASAGTLQRQILAKDVQDIRP